MQESEDYIIHSSQFNKIEKDLLELYKSYRNKEKIVALLEYWLFAIKHIKEVYGNQGLKKLTETIETSPLRYAFYFEFNSVINLNMKKGHLIFLRIILFFFSKLKLPGASGVSIFSKILNKISSWAARSLVNKTSIRKKEKLNQILRDYFQDNDASLSEVLSQRLPEVFYSDPIKSNQISDLVLEGSSHSFMDFFGYEKFLLLDCYIQVEGYQHGGGYDSFHQDYYSLFEKNLCDKFIGWGFAEENIKQTRYSGIKEKRSMQNLERVIWIERPKYPRLMKPMNNGQYIQHKSLKVIETIGSALNLSGIEYYSATYPSNLKSNDYRDCRGLHLNNQTLRTENELTSNDILIFDSSAASLIHFCIENKLKFFIIIDRESSNFFTPKKEEWFNLLRKHGYAFYDEESLELSKAIKKAYNPSTIYPEEIYRFNKEVFKAG